MYSGRQGLLFFLGAGKPFREKHYLEYTVIILASEILKQSFPTSFHHITQSSSAASDCRLFKKGFINNVGLEVDPGNSPDLGTAVISGS